MKIQRLFSITLAMALTLTLAVPALAGEEELPLEETPEWVDVQVPELDEEYILEPDEEPVPIIEEPVTDVVSGPDEQPDSNVAAEPVEQTPNESEQQGEESIDVVIPAVGEIILNPYHMPIETDAGTVRTQVLHQAQTITNNSNFPVMVTATVSGTLEGDAQFAAAAPSDGSKDKEIFLYTEFQNESDTWTDTYTAAHNQLLVTADENTGDVLTLDTKESGYFRLSGAMTAAPETKWSSKNALTVTITYTFAHADDSDEAKPPETSEPTDSDESQPPETSEPTNPDENQPPEMAEPTDPDESQPPETSKPSDPDENQPPETAEPTDSDESQPPETAGTTRTDESTADMDMMEVVEEVFLEEPVEIKEELPADLDLTDIGEVSASPAIQEESK